MLVLSCSHLSRAFDRDTLFEDLGFELYYGERVGIVGPNGAGKTTLMKILAGHDQPDSGDVRLHGGAKLMLLEQQASFAPDRTLFAEAKSAFDHLIAAQEELIQVAERMSVVTDPLEQKAVSARFDQLSELLSHQDAYSIDHRVAEVLGGLGFLQVDYDRPLATFSGGQQRRLLLAKLLLANPEVMLLDEPSNHLDIDATRWLENYLAAQPQAMLIVSHDRYFLNRVVNKIFELSNRQITSYPGNFNQYVRLRQERYEQRLKEYEAQQEYIEKQEEIIRRMHYGQMAKMAQSRKKALDKVEEIERPVLIQAPQMQFGKVVRAGDIIFHAEDLCKSFAEKTLFTDLNLTLERGKRLGIMGPNGVGKTTLLKILLGEEKPTSGQVRQGALVEYGDLDQHLKLLDDNKSILRAVWPEPDPEITEQKMRDLLGRFGLSGKIIEQPIRECSGGERSRAALARLVVQGANVLILDEPTNHLDIWACDALEEAIKQFEGTVIVVSHDRYFLNRIAEILIVMEPGRCEVVYGNYDTYELLRAARAQAEAEEAARKQRHQPAPSKKEAPAAGTNKPGKKKRKFPFRKVADLENDIAQQEALVAKLEESLSSAEVYRDANLFRDTMKAHEEGKAKLAQLYEHWEEAVELN